MVMGQIGQIDLFHSNYFKTEKATMSQANDWYEKVLKTEKYNLENQSCKATYMKDGKKTETNLENDDGMENFKKLIINPSVTGLWMKTNALLILGDVVDVGAKNLNINGKLDNQKLWIKRLKCGWNLFYQNLEKFNAAKIAPLSLTNSTNSNFKVMVNDELEVIPGESAFDVDIKEEEKIFKKIRTMQKEHKYFKLEKTNFGEDKQKWNTITHTPKLITISFHTHFNIQFLDFNSAVIACANNVEAEYKKCAANHFSQVAHKDAMAYLEKVNNAMFKFKEDTLREKTWRVMRTTIPPFNSDSGDAQFYFQDFTVGKTKVNLYNTMKERKVEIFIASTIQNAQVISMPYNNTYKYNDPKKCNDKASETMGCYETKPGKFNEDPKASKMCDPKLLKYDLPVRDITNAVAHSTMLHVFIIGNSGKDLEPVKGGKMTGGILIWNRSMKQDDGKSFNNGFMRVIFSRMYVEVKYYEIRATDSGMQEVAKFTVAPAALPKAEETQKFLTNKCK